MTKRHGRPARSAPDVGMGQPDADLAKVFEDEALRVVQAGEQKGVPLRIIGALAFHHHCPQFGWIQAKLNRVYTDIDFAALRQADPSRSASSSSRSATTRTSRSTPSTPRAAG